MNNSFPLEDVCKTLITERMIKYISAKAASVIQCSPPPVTLLSGRAITPPPTPNSPDTSSYNSTTTSYPTRSESQVTQIPPLPLFISNVVERSRAQTPTLLSMLVYLDRLQRLLPRAAKGMPCTCHRVFLAALILAAKYTNDSSPKNKHWARYSSVFSLAEVNLMEKQLLFLLNFDLRIHESQLIAQIRPFFNQDINRTPTIAKPVLPGLSVAFADTLINSKRIQPVPEPHLHPLQNLSVLSDFQKISNSPCNHAVGKLPVPFHASLLESEHNNHASFYPSPSHSDTVDGSSRRSSISDPDTPATIDTDPTSYCYGNYPHIVVDGCLAVADAIQSHSYYPHHVRAHTLSGGAIC